VQGSARTWTAGTGSMDSAVVAAIESHIVGRDGNVSPEFLDGLRARGVDLTPEQVAIIAAEVRSRATAGRFPNPSAGMPRPGPNAAFTAYGRPRRRARRTGCSLLVWLAIIVVAILAALHYYPELQTQIETLLH
jgi:hypothetical protein